MFDPEKNIIITGLPRSGTTLLTAMIDSAPDAAALVEPFWQFKFARENQDMPAKDFVKWLTGDFIELRRKFINGEDVFDKRSPETGEIPTNIFRKNPMSLRVDKEKDVVSEVKITKSNLTENFLLAVKHTSPYLSILDELLASQAFTVIIVYRDPMSVICSWRSLPDLPLNSGRMPGAMRFWTEMRAVINSNFDTMLEKQIKVMEVATKKIIHMKQRHPKLIIIDYASLNKDLLERTILTKITFSLDRHRSRTEYPNFNELEHYGEMLDAFYADVKKLAAI